MVEYRDERRGLYVGRFQPFHLGHLYCVKLILGKVPEVVIAIGSSQFSHTLQNPFTTGERVTMIRLALKEAGIDPSRYYLIPVRDLKIHDLWVPHLISQTPRFEGVFSNEPLTSRLFREAGFRVEPIPLYEREIYSSTSIRERLIRGERWDNLVPNSVADYIRAILGEERLRELVQNDKPKTGLSRHAHPS